MSSSSQLITALKDELGIQCIQRINKILENFHWNIRSLVEENKDELIRFMREEYSPNTCRMYSTDMTRLFRSDVVRQLYANQTEYEDALVKWKMARRMITSEERKPKWKANYATEVPWKPNEILGNIENLPSDVYKDAFVLTQKALEMVASNNAPGAVHFLVQKYIMSRIGTCTEQDKVRLS